MTAWQLTGAMLAFAGLGLGQGPRGPHGQGVGTGRAGSVLDMAKVQTVAGAVSAVDIGYGMQYPSITVNRVKIKVAPVWHLLDKGFEIKAGDPVSVAAAPSRDASDPYLHAIEIANLGSKLRIVLRDAAGVPEWTGGNGGGQMAQGGCTDPTAVATAAGVIDQFTAGAGIQMPALTLQTADGKLLTFKLGPERILLAAGVELKAGDKVTVRYAAGSCTDEMVALSITTAAGDTIRLRKDDCTPAW